MAETKYTRADGVIQTDIIAVKMTDREYAGVDVYVQTDRECSKACYEDFHTLIGDIHTITGTPTDGYKVTYTDCYDTVSTGWLSQRCFNELYDVVPKFEHTAVLAPVEEDVAIQNPRKLGGCNQKTISEEDSKKLLDENTAPRVTEGHINSIISKTEYHRLTDVLTVAVIHLKNGFTVTGESACASPENYNKKLGEKYSYDKAYAKIWVLEGYLLTQKLFELSKYK